MFDINSVKELDSATLKLQNPITGEPVGAEITLASVTHPKRKAVEFARQRAQLAKVAKKGRLELPDPQESADYEVDRLVACTLSWSGIARDGKPIECNAGEVRALYESAGWVRQQAVAFLDEAANFLQSSSPA